MAHRRRSRQSGSRLPAPLMALIMAATALAVTSASVAADDDAATMGSVVVTTEVLGAVVAEIVGDTAEVTVLMPGGANPHTFESSARAAEQILEADVVVSNGLDLEEGLLSILESAEREGATWFQAADHVAVRGRDAGDEAEPGHESDQGEHQHGDDDPHFWTDPLAMRDVVVALEPVLAGAGLDVASNVEAVLAELEALDAEVADILAVLPPGRRKLVTGHRSMAYFADRYGFDLVGTVIPSLSTNGEPSAREMARLIEDIRSQGVRVVFAEVGTPQSVAQAVAADSGARLVTLSTSQLPEEGTYESLIRAMATTVAEALAD